MGPSLEMGYQWSNYFDVFYGFSWFTASNSMSVSSVIQGTASSTSIVDTFPFLSDDTSAWPVFTFNSSNSVVDGDLNFTTTISLPTVPLMGEYSLLVNSAPWRMQTYLLKSYRKPSPTPLNSPPWRTDSAQEAGLHYGVLAVSERY